MEENLDLSQKRSVKAKRTQKAVNQMDFQGLIPILTVSKIQDSMTFL